MSIESGLIGAALTLAAGVALQPPLPKSAWPGGGEAVATLEQPMWIRALRATELELIQVPHPMRTHRGHQPAPDWDGHHLHRRTAWRSHR